MDRWRDQEITGDLSEVPGIGQSAITMLKNYTSPITTTYQLIGTYLNLKQLNEDDKITDPLVHNDAMWFLLKRVGISAHRSAIVKALALKAATWMPNIYDANEYAGDDDDDDNDE